MKNERLHDLDTVLTYEEIEELRNICYEYGSSWCPISDFFNDIERTTNNNYNKNQAFKDLWLIVNIILEKAKKLKALAIIKEKRVNVPSLILLFKSQTSYENYEQLWDNDIRWQLTKNWDIQFSRKKLTQEEYELLKEVLL